MIWILGEAPVVTGLLWAHCGLPPQTGELGWCHFLKPQLELRWFCFPPQKRCSPHRASLCTRECHDLLKHMSCAIQGWSLGAMADPCDGGNSKARELGDGPACWPASAWCFELTIAPLYSPLCGRGWKPGRRFPEAPPTGSM